MQAETEKATKRAEKKAEEAAKLAETVAATQAELDKLKKEGAGASKELQSLREQADQLALVQAHEAELDEALKAQTTEMGQLETRYKEQVTLRPPWPSNGRASPGPPSLCAAPPSPPSPS